MAVEMNFKTALHITLHKIIRFFVSIYKEGGDGCHVKLYKTVNNKQKWNNVCKFCQIPLKKEPLNLWWRKQLIYCKQGCNTSQKILSDSMVQGIYAVHQCEFPQTCKRSDHELRIFGPEKRFFSQWSSFCTVLNKEPVAFSKVAPTFLCLG